MMGRKKITVVGAGNVGATAAYMLAGKALGDIVLIDIVAGLAEGKALDIAQAGPIELFDCDITGTTDWTKATDSDIIIITSGLPRKPGMSRDDLLAINLKIVKNVSESIKKYCPDSIVIVVCNPLDAMTYAVAKVTGLKKNKIIGMAGALDAARYCYFIACQLGVSKEDVKCVLMGGHGDDMVPLPRFTTVCGVALCEFLSEEKIKLIIERTRKGGIEIVNLLGYSAYYAPAAGAVKMADAILNDKRIILSCCAYCDKEYDVGGYFVGVPVILGDGGVVKIVSLDLNSQERSEFERSLEHIKELTLKVDSLF
jgi:malate dehydrogenase